MKTFKYLSGLYLKTSIAALFAISCSSTAFAQGTFNVKIKYTISKSVGTSYASMEKQSKKYCGREARRTIDRISPQRQREIYIQKCVAQVMDKVISEINDKKLTKYHLDRQSHPNISASKMPTE